MALKEWLACSAIEQGPVFRRVTRWGEVLTETLHPSSVNAILKDGAAGAGLDFALGHRLNPSSAKAVGSRRHGGGIHRRGAAVRG